MANTYKGIAGNISYPSVLTLSQVISAGPPCVFLCTTAHGLSVGDTVVITGVQSTTLNGTFAVTGVPAVDQFAISATAGGAGLLTPGCRAQAVAFAAAVTQPSDGDPASAASVDTPFSGEADRGVALLLATGAYKLADFGHVVRNLSGLVTSYGSVTTAAAFTDAISTMGAELQFTGTDGVQAGDVVEIELHTSVEGATVGKNYGISLYASNVDPGASDSFARISGAGMTWKQAIAGAIPAAIKAWYVVGTTGILKVAIYGQTNNSAADVINFYDDETIVARVWRATNCPQ